MPGTLPGYLGWDLLVNEGMRGQCEAALREREKFSRAWGRGYGLGMNRQFT